MNYLNLAILIIRFFGFYSICYALVDALYCLHEFHDPKFDLFHYYINMAGARLIVGFVAIRYAVPIGKLFAKDLN